MSTREYVEQVLVECELMGAEYWELAEIEDIRSELECLSLRSRALREEVRARIELDLGHHSADRYWDMEVSC